MTLSIHNQRTQDIAVSVTADGRRLEMITKEGLTTTQVICSSKSHEDVVFVEWDAEARDIRIHKRVVSGCKRNRYKIFHQNNETIMAVDLETIPRNDIQQRKVAEARMDVWKNLRQYDADVLPEGAIVLQWDVEKGQWVDDTTD